MYPCVLGWKWTCIKVGTEGPEYIATIKHMSETNIFFLNKKFEIFFVRFPCASSNCLNSIQLKTSSSGHIPQQLMPNNILHNINSTARNTAPPSPPGTAYTNCLRKNTLHWLDLSAFSCCWDLLFKQFPQLPLHLLHKCMKAGIQQTNSQEGLQVTLCQRTVAICSR